MKTISILNDILINYQDPCQFELLDGKKLQSQFNLQELSEVTKNSSQPVTWLKRIVKIQVELIGFRKQIEPLPLSNRRNLVNILEYEIKENNISNFTLYVMRKINQLVDSNQQLAFVTKSLV
ncbi:unnamed protein product [Paramecium octaurelia]|uniref:Uncharacterized protein n=1 Tax=Paramecium octaurelia TaxID=43137 RepID=A0A8S1TZF9_PAROT|nr:unnamed protein product [Paramecium octaurelia]